MRIAVCVFAAVLVAMAATGAAAEREAGVTVSVDDVRTSLGAQLDHGWLFRVGDDPAWADPELDDSDWQPVAPGRVGPPPGDDDAVWVGWFRLHLDILPELLGQPLVLTVTQLGAIEYYFDGRFVRSLGTIDPSRESTRHYVCEQPELLPVAIGQSRHHVIAVRFALHNARERAGYRFPKHPNFAHGGFIMTLGLPELTVAENRRQLLQKTVMRTVVASAALTIAILHLLLFVFYPRQIGHLYYALFTFCASGLAYLPTKMQVTTDTGDFAVVMRLMGICLVLISITGLRFLYSRFYDHLPRVFWFWVAAGVIVGVVFWNGPVTYVTYYSLATFVEIFRILIVAVWRRKPYAGLISIGVAAFIVASAFQIVTQIIFKDYDGPEYFLHGMLVMLILLSVSLALGYAQINRTLASKLAEVERLSAERLEQERRAKEQEMERVRLEADNALKATELEEARKRQKVLDELEATNHELQQTQSQLVHSEKMAALGNLVAGVAHEINTPVGAISSMHDTLVRAVGKLKNQVAEDERDKVKDTVAIIEKASEVIQSGSERVTGIVRRLRSFARLDEAEIKKVDIHEGLEDTLTVVHHELKHHVTVHRNYGKIPQIACYPGQLNQVFLNLLVNAGQAIEGEGEITLTTSQRDGKVYIEIKDTGRGIPEGQIGKIFDPGFTTKGVGVGTGLGLSICYRIVQDHKGEILVDSEVGKGTTFTVVLPMDLDDTGA